MSFLFLTGLEQINHLVYACGTRFRSFGALDPFNVCVAIENVLVPDLAMTVLKR
jgi:hypothetical protein